MMAARAAVAHRLGPTDDAAAAYEAAAGARGGARAPRHERLLLLPGAGTGGEEGPRTPALVARGGALVGGTGTLPAPAGAALASLTSQTVSADLDSLLPLLAPSSGGTRREERGHAAAAAHLAKAALGAGVVAVPFCWAVLGAVPGTAAMAATAALIWYSCRCLALAAADSGQTSFSGVLVHQLGRWAGVALDLCMILNVWGERIAASGAGFKPGVMVIMAQITADLLTSDELQALGAPAWLHRLMASHAAVLGLATLLGVAPLLAAADALGGASAAASALGLLALAVWVGATCCVAGVAAAARRGAPVPLWPRWDMLPGGPGARRRAIEIAGLAPVLMGAFVCQPAFFRVAAQALRPQPPSARAMSAAAGAAIAFCFALFVLLSLASQVVFGRVRENALADFTVAGLKQALGSVRGAVAVAAAVRLLYAASIALTFPVFMQPFRESVTWLAHARKSYSSLRAPPLSRAQAAALTYGCLASIYVVAVAVPTVYRPLQLVGALPEAAIVFFLPAALRLRLGGWAPWRPGNLPAAALLAVGVAQSAAGVVSAALGFKG